MEMCKEVKSANVSVTIGEYAGFKMAVSFDSLNHKFVMNLKGQLSHNLEVGADPFGNITRINHALEAMPKELDNAKVKLENVERQLETAKAEVTKPFAQETELKEKLDRLSALNALLNMDETGSDVQVENEVSEQSEADTFGHDDQRAEQPQADTLGHSDQRQELAGNIPQSVPVENAGHNHVAENNSPHGLKLVAGNNDKPAKASLKEKLEAYKAQVAGVENTGTDKTKGKGYFSHPRQI